MRLHFVGQEFLGHAFEPDQCFVHGYKYEPDQISFAKKLMPMLHLKGIWLIGEQLRLRSQPTTIYLGPRNCQNVGRLPEKTAPPARSGARFGRFDGYNPDREARETLRIRSCQSANRHSLKRKSTERTPERS